MTQTTNITEIQGIFHEVGLTEENSFRNPESIKQELVSKLIAEVYNNGCIEFTKQYDGDSNAITYRARMFVTPDSICRILKKEYNATVRN